MTRAVKIEEDVSEVSSSSHGVTVHVQSRLVSSSPVQSLCDSAATTTSTSTSTLKRDDSRQHSTAQHAQLASRSRLSHILLTYLPLLCARLPSLAWHGSRADFRAELQSRASEQSRDTVQYEQSRSVHSNSSSSSSR